MPFVTRSFVIVVTALLATSCSDSCRAEPHDTHVASVQGKWTRKQRVAGRTVTFIKEHRDNRTTLTAYAGDMRVLYAHKSEFKIERSGKVLIFVFFNRTVTAGEQAGKTIKGPESFVFRVANQRFIEVHGVQQEDTEPPSMIIWTRMNSAANE